MTAGTRSEGEGRLGAETTALLAQLPAAVVAVDPSGTPIWWNEAAEALLGAELVLATLDDLENLAAVRGGLVRMETAAGAARDGSPVTWLVAWEGQGDEALLGALAHQALHDPLTGLPNRSLLRDRIQQGLARASRNGLGVAVIFLDLDHFKLINDTQGHAAGDTLLQAVAGRLSATVRAGDTVARFGGDEFVVVGETVKDADEATHLAERLRLALDEPFDLGGDPAYVSASLGVVLGAPTATPDDLLRDADAAMYHAKSAGRSRTQLFDEDIRARATRRRDTENDLRVALTEGELHLVYQPVVSLEAGWIVGAEALVRWSHPERGLVLPGEFIPVAEETGLIGPLGEWVLDEACRQLGQWRSDLPRVPLFMSVNVSARQLRRGVADLITDTAARHGVDPSRLVVEITEGCLMEDVSSCLETLTEIKGTGAQIAVDDFGVGYSSLSYLKAFPIDTMKIDRAFVSGLGTDADDSAIVSALAAIARGLRMTVVAEGVETSEQLAALRRMGCQYAQGYRLARPLPAPEFADLVRSGQRW